MVIIKVESEEDETLYELDFPSSGGTLSKLLNEMKRKGINLPEKLQIIKNEEIEIKDDKNLNFEYGDKLLLRDASSLESFAVNYIDVTKTLNMISLKVENDDSIPKCLTVHPGLNLLGECINKNCKAKEICWNIKDNEYDLIKEKGIMKCPYCGIEIKSNLITFYNCYYNYYGKKYINGNIEEFGKRVNNFQNVNILNDNIIMIDGQKYEIHKTKIGENDYFFDDDNKVKFIELIFQVSKF